MIEIRNIACRTAWPASVSIPRSGAFCKLPSSQKIGIREDKESCADEGEHPKKNLFLSYHSQVDHEETKSIKGMEDEQQQDRKIKSSILMKDGEPGDFGAFSD